MSEEHIPTLESIIAGFREEISALIAEPSPNLERIAALTSAGIDISHAISALRRTTYRCEECYDTGEVSDGWSMETCRCRQ